MDYLFPNDAEATLVTRTDTVEEAAEALLRAGVGTVVIKCASRGCLMKNRAREFWSPAVEGVHCVDTTGAGDSFVGGFLYGLAQELPLEACAAHANQCGAKAVQQVGATTWIAP